MKFGLLYKIHQAAPFLGPLSYMGSWIRTQPLFIAKSSPPPRRTLAKSSPRLCPYRLNGRVPLRRFAVHLSSHFILQTLKKSLCPMSLYLWHVVLILRIDCRVKMKSGKISFDRSSGFFTADDRLNDTGMSWVGVTCKKFSDASFFFYSDASFSFFEFLLF